MPTWLSHVVPQSSIIQRRHLSQDSSWLFSTKHKALVASKASIGHYDFDKPENIIALYQQSNRTKWKKKKCHLELSEAIRAGLKAQDPASCRVIYPACDIKFADTREQLKSPSFKPTTQRNLKHKAPDVLCYKVVLVIVSNSRLYWTVQIPSLAKQKSLYTPTHICCTFQYI